LPCLYIGIILVLCGTERERHVRAWSFSISYRIIHWPWIFTILIRINFHIVVLGPSKEFRVFFLQLHRDRVQFQPRELQQYPLHPQRPLILLEGSPDDKLCHFCDEHIYEGYAYHCSNCNFNLHLKRASIPFTVEGEFHDRPLKLLRKSVSFTFEAWWKKIKTCTLTYVPVSHTHSWSTENVLPCHWLSNIQVTSTLSTSPAVLRWTNLIVNVVVFVLKR
jgi:hypothetical protein